MTRWTNWRAFATFLLAALMLTGGAQALSATPPTPQIKPPAPGPAYLTRLDYARLATIHKALERDEFSLARAEIAYLEDPVARSLGEWLYYMAKDSDVDIRAAGAFLSAHDDWPATSRIQRQVESRIDAETPTSAILDFFGGRAPQTGDGKIHLARALLSVGKTGEADALIADAWINHEFSVSGERRILNNYAGRLSADDHAARVDRLLWARQVTNARRTFPYLSASDRRMAEARASLLLGASSGPGLYRALGKEQQLDSGVLQAAVRYYRRSDEEQYAISLASDAPLDPAEVRNGDRWWTERRLLLQWALKNGRPRDAYGLASRHGLEDGGDFADAEFVAGWIALRFLNEADRALTHFEAMTGAVGTPISLSRGYYWMGRAAAAAGEDEDAKAYYEQAANYHYSFYGQLAAEALGGPALVRKFDAPRTITPEARAAFNARPGVKALGMLSDLGLDYEFMVFAYHLDDQLDRPGEFLMLADITNGEGAPHLTVRAGKAGVRQDIFEADVSYPLVHVPDEARAFVRPEIILGLSRQESEFNPRAYSRAGARGLMQLIPSTAQLTARKEGLPYRRSALLDDPVYNMIIGSAHLSHLLDRYDGSLILTFAAYNAGPHRADRWIEEYGDPRHGDVDPVDWIELIPFSETRNYVQRVLENTQVYRGRLNDAPIPGALAGDIERGGPPGRIARIAGPSARLTALTGAALPPLPSRTMKLAAMFRQDLMSAPDGEPATPPAGPTPAPTITPTITPKTTPATVPGSKATGLKTPDPGPATSEAPVVMDEKASRAVPEDTPRSTSPPTPTSEPTPVPVAQGAAAPAPSSDPKPAPLPPTLAAPVEGAPSPGPSLAPGPDPQALPLSPNAAFLEPGEITAESAPGDGMEACLTYRDFLARNAEEETAAEDLNAGMLAELAAEGEPCG